jgi:hypothetical protein
MNSHSILHTWALNRARYLNALDWNPERNQILSAFYTFPAAPERKKPYPLFGKNVIFSSCRGAWSTRGFNNVAQCRGAETIFIPARVYTPLRMADN